MLTKVVNLVNANCKRTNEIKLEKRMNSYKQIAVHRSFIGLDIL